VPQPFNLQVAFQGGGAKIALLLAAAEGLQELSEGKNPLIRITHIAGTSAGAIVGALLAAKVPIAEVRKSLAGSEGAELLSKFQLPTSKKAAALGLWWNDGKPLWSVEPLRVWLRGQFAKSPLIKGAQPLTVGDLNFTVVSSDLVRTATGIYEAGDDLVEAVIDSAALPICFRTWTHPGKELRVDGGLCENLPIERLQVEDEKKGPVIAFSFQEGASTRPNDFWTFGMSLLNAAIAHSVRSARQRLTEDAVCVLKAETPIDTFDFEPALAWLKKEGYVDLKKSTRKWVASYVDEHSYGSSQQIVGDLWCRPSGGALRDHMRRIGRLYRDTHEDTRVRFRDVALFVTAYSLLPDGSRDFGRPDAVTYRIEIEAVKEPVYAHRLSLSNPISAAFFGHYSLDVQDKDGQPVEFEAFASLSPEPDDAMDRQMVVFFKRPLKPRKGRYVITLKDTGTNLVWPLVDKFEDGFVLWHERATGKIGRVTLGLHVPERYDDIVIVPDKSSEGFALNKAANDAPLKFRTLAWVARNLELPWQEKPVQLTFARPKPLENEGASPISGGGSSG
jgi:predicted acylesterase/phospholipase RssA